MLDLGYMHDEIIPIHQTSAALACLAVRLALEFKTTEWHNNRAEHILVENHLRICISPKSGFREAVTISPSEPLVAEAARHAMKDRPDLDVALALLHHIKQSQVDAGTRGETVALVLLFIQAMDAALQTAKSVHEQHSGTEEYDCNDPESNLKHDGMSRVVPLGIFLSHLIGDSNWKELKPSNAVQGAADTPLEDAIEDCYVFFDHAIRYEVHSTFSPDRVWSIAARGGFIICALGQAGFDLIIIYLKGRVLQQSSIGYILIQVKNDKAYGSKLHRSLFDNMDPKLLYKDARELPVIRMVFALGSKKPKVAFRTPQSSLHHPPSSSYTSYDIWLAGATSSTFPVIDVKQEKHYEECLAYSRKKTPYSLKGTVRSNFAMAEHRRRVENPGVDLSHPSHYESYAQMEDYVSDSEE